MKTVQILKRSFYDGVIRQNHKTEFFNMNDLVEIGNRYRKSLGMAPANPQKYWKAEKTKEFISQILEEKQISSVKITARGRGGSTWVHPLIFIDMAMWINPKFKVKVFDWIYDNLAVFRDSSGESYKKMTGVLDKNYNLGAKCGVVIPVIARKIKKATGVEDWNKATPEQLALRDKIHEKVIFGSKYAKDINVLTDDAIRESLNGN